MGWIWGDHERLLSGNEQELIKRVFRSTDLPHLSQIRIRNGISTINTPFTTLGKSTLKLLSGYPLKSEGQYLIMVGSRLFDCDLALNQPATLVHEMVHVWQYQQGTLTEFQGLAAHAFQHLSAKLSRKATNNLYTYEIGQSWNDMGFEGQAQLVEDWYLGDQMDEKSDRWPYIFNVLIMNDKDTRYQPLEALRKRDDNG